MNLEINPHDTGVTLEMLTPFLLCEIEVFVPKCGYRGILRYAGHEGNSADTSSHVVMLWVASQNCYCKHHPMHCLPVLWGYEDILCKQPNNTVPAYEYVRFMWPDQPKMHHKAYLDIIEVWGTTALYMFQKKNFETLHLHLQGTEYLRSLGYAVGFAPHQFIRKTAAAEPSPDTVAPVATTAGHNNVERQALVAATKDRPEFFFTRKS